MHFFLANIKNSKPQPQPLPDHQNQAQINQQHPEVEQKVIKKILVRKKPQIQLSTINDHIIETESQDFVSEHKTTKKAQILNFPQRDKNQQPFMSFMVSDSENQGMNTPYLNTIPTNYNFKDQTINMQSSQSHEGRNLGRTMSRPIEPVSFETPSSKNMGNNQQFIRQNSIRTEFQEEGQQRQMNKYPTQISLQTEEVNSGYGVSGGEKMPKFTMLRDKQMEISVLDSKNSEQMNNSGFPNDIPTSKSSKFIFRPQLFKANTGNSNNQMNLVEEIQDNDSQSQGSGRNHKDVLNKLALSNKLTEVLNNSRSVSGQNSERSNVEQTQNLAYGTNSSPGYKSYIDKQNRELQEQRQRMNFYAQEANKLLCNVETYDFNQAHYEVLVDKHYVPLKYMIEELVELFSIGEVIKYQLRYRSYQILTKIFAQASNYYNEKIPLEEPIKAYTFSLALKAILNEYEKSEIDTVVTKIFQSSHVISYDDFLLQFSSVLNGKLVSILQPDSMKKQVDKTLQKIKNLFVIWIETEYYNKKVKEILRSSKIVYDTIMTECSMVEQPHKFDIELLQKFFLQGERKNPMKKIKLDLYFRSLIGNDLLKAKWTEWINKDEMRLYNRYQSKLMYERRKFANRTDKTDLASQIKTEKTIINKRKLKINLEENYLSRRTDQSRKII